MLRDLDAKVAAVAVDDFWAELRAHVTQQLNSFAVARGKP